MLSYSFLGEGSPTKIDYRKKGTLILTSLLEDLVKRQPSSSARVARRFSSFGGSDLELRWEDRAWNLFLHGEILSTQHFTYGWGK